MIKTATEMLSALEAKLSKEELRRQIDNLRRDPATGDIRMRTIAAVAELYKREFQGDAK